MADEDVQEDPRAPSRVVTVVAEPSEGGAVAGGGTYGQGMTVTVSAEAHAGFEFQGWVDGGTGQVMSSEATYAFVVGAADVALQANFAVGGEPCCGNCEYGREAPGSAAIGEKQLSCCRYAPALWGVMQHPPALPVAWKWPIVRADWWCGEHEAGVVASERARVRWAREGLGQ